MSSSNSDAAFQHQKGVFARGNRSAPGTPTSWHHQGAWHLASADISCSIRSGRHSRECFLHCISSTCACNVHPSTTNIKNVCLQWGTDRMENRTRSWQCQGAQWHEFIQSSQRGREHFPLELKMFGNFSLKYEHEKTCVCKGEPIGCGSSNKLALPAPGVWPGQLSTTLSTVALACSHQVL